MTSKLEADLDLRCRPSVFGLLTPLLFVPQDPALPPFTRCSTFYSMFLSLPTPRCTFRTRMGLQWPPTPSTAPAGVALWYGHTTETPEPKRQGCSLRLFFCCSSGVLCGPAWVGGVVVRCCELVPPTTPASPTASYFHQCLYSRTLLHLQFALT